MKYVSPEKNQTLHRLAQKRWRKKINRKNRNHIQNQIYKIKINSSIVDISKYIRKIIAPEELSLSKNYLKTMKFIDALRNFGTRYKIPIIVDLSEVKKIGVSAALLLVSEIDRARRLGMKSKITGVYPRCNSIRRFMKEVGFFDLIQVKNPDYEFDRSLSPQPDLMYVKFKSGHKVNNAEVKNLRIDLEKLIDQKIPDNIRQNFFESLAEAMTNATEHAYGLSDDSATPRIRNRWWMSAAVNHDEDAIMVALFDQGVGIPFHLKRSHSSFLKHFFREHGPSRSDKDLIRAATKLSQSGTGLKNRGLGLQAIKQLANLAPNCNLKIFSGSGLYEFNGQRETMKNLSCNIGGTMIQWTLTFDALEMGMQR